MAGKCRNRKRGAYQINEVGLTQTDGKALADDLVGRIADRLTPPPYDPIAKDDERNARARSRITLKKFSWE